MAQIIKLNINYRKYRAYKKALAIFWIPQLKTARFPMPP